MSNWNNLTAADWNDPASYNMFVDAINERDLSPVLYYASNSVGNPAQSATWVAFLQGRIVQLLDGTVLTGSPPPYSNRWFTTNNLAGETAASYGAAFMYSFASMTTAVVGSVGFTRKRPLEFANMAATTYEVSGASFVNGDNARCLADGIVYTRTAGAWVNSGAILPDIFTVNNAAGTNDNEWNGIAQEGDIIDLWIYQELRDIINLMLHREENTNGWMNGGANNSNSGSAYVNSPYTVLATAEADADADYDGGANLSAVVANVPPSTQAFTSYDSGTGEYQASISRGANKVEIVTLLSSAAKTVRYYCAATRYNNDEWSGNGDFTTEGLYDLISTASELAATTTSHSALVGDMSVKPAWPVATPGASPVTRGYSVADANTGSPGFIDYSTHSPVIIATYDFAYGPTT